VVRASWVQRNVLIQVSAVIHKVFVDWILAFVEQVALEVLALEVRNELLLE
jgi:hypothetical protein